MYDMSHLSSESGGVHPYHRENRTEVIHDDDDFSNSGFHRKIVFLLSAFVCLYFFLSDSIMPMIVSELCHSDINLVILMVPF